MLNPFLGIILNASFKYPLSWAHDMHIMNTYNHCTVLCEDFENSIWKSQPQVSIWGRALGERGCANSGHSFPLSKALLRSCGPPRTLQWSWGLKSLNHSSGPLYKLYAYVCPMQSALYAITNRYIFFKGHHLNTGYFHSLLGLLGPDGTNIWEANGAKCITTIYTRKFANAHYAIQQPQLSDQKASFLLSLSLIDDNMEDYFLHLFLQKYETKIFLKLCLLCNSENLV